MAVSSRSSRRSTTRGQKRTGATRSTTRSAANDVFPIRASDTTEVLADWLEWKALKSDDRNSAIQDLVQEIRRNGTLDALPTDSSRDRGDAGGEQSEGVAQAVSDLLDFRSRACGPTPGGYPFDVANGSIQLQPGGDASVYVFLHLLTRYGLVRAPGVERADILFEDVSRHAAEAYFGGPGEHVLTYPFGFPRRLKPRHFPRALDDLCETLGEGTSHRQRPTSNEQKDAKLDLVVWRRFADDREGKLIGFGQCATGSDWREKLSEIDPDSFLRLWVSGDVPVRPVKLFFVPRHVDSKQWIPTATIAGIVFDRGRIVQLARHLDSQTMAAVGAWSSHVLAKKVRR